MPKVCAMNSGNGFLNVGGNMGLIPMAKGIEDGLDHWEGVRSAKERNEETGSKPIPNEDGNVVMTHYSNTRGLQTLDPTKQGTGLRGSNFRAGYNGPGQTPYTSFGLNVGHPRGYKKEQGLGEVTYISEMPIDRIYDIEKDPADLKLKRDELVKQRNIPPMDIESQTQVLIEVIKNAGYAGIFIKNGNGAGLSAAIWEPTEVQEVKNKSEALAKSTASNFSNMLEGWNITPEEIAISREKAKEAMGKDKKYSYKQPEALRKIAANKLIKDPKVNLDKDFEWASAVIKSNYIIPLGAVQKIPTFREMIRSLKSKATAGLIRQGGGQGYERIPMGKRVSSRLDIPSYLETDTWIVTVHHIPTEKKGTVIGYAKSAVLNNVEFAEFNNAAKNVAAGIKNKSTFARMEGDWVDASAIQAEQMANEALNNPDWVEVGMNPNRYGYFYIKETGQRILSSPQVIQVGPLVMAKITENGQPIATIEETPHSQLLSNPSRESADSGVARLKDRQIIKDLPFELLSVLKNDLAPADGIEYYEYTKNAILKEARYLQSKYDGNIGFEEQESLGGLNGKSEQQIAKKEYGAIKRFIAKHA